MVNIVEKHLELNANNIPFQRGMEVVIVPYRKDNYGFLIHLPTSGATVAIDAGDDTAYLKVLEERGWKLGWILLTHHHDDHISHAKTLSEKTGATIMGPETTPASNFNSSLKHHVGDGTTMNLGGVVGSIGILAFTTPGHTLDMVNYYIREAKAVFTGDTLFTLGCGRLFEGTPEMMFESMKKLHALPDETRVYGAHEYTIANLDFALSEFPQNEALQNRAEIIRTLRDQGKPTVPSTIGAEKATNPFLLATNAQEFVRLRSTKDAF